MGKKKRQTSFAKRKIVKEFERNTVKKFVKENIEPTSKIQTDELAIDDTLANLGMKQKKNILLYLERD